MRRHISIVLAAEASADDAEACCACMKTVSLLDSITATHDNFDATANARIKIDGQEEEAKCCVATNPCVERTRRCGFGWIEADQECHAECSGTEALDMGQTEYCASLGYTFCYVRIYPRAQRIRKKKAQRNSRRVTSARGLDAGGWCDLY